MTMMFHLPRRSSNHEVDVDVFIAKQERRKSLKKLFKPLTHTFRLSKHHHEQGHEDSLSTMTGSSGSNSHFGMEGVQIDVDQMSVEEGEIYLEGDCRVGTGEGSTTATGSTDTATVKIMLTMGVVCSIAMATNNATKEEDYQVEDLDNDMAFPSLEEDSSSDKKELPQGLLQEIVNYKRPTTTDVVLPKPQQQQQQEEVQALQEKCANLATLTELLGKKLVESTLSSKREHSLQRKEGKQYQNMIVKLEAQHRAQMEAWQADKRYLQEKLRYNTVESVPPCITSPPCIKKNLKSPPKKGRRQRGQRRHSFLDTFVTPIEQCCHGNNSQATSSRRASFSMASTMIIQNRLLPAMLSAVAQHQPQHLQSRGPAKDN